MTPSVLAQYAARADAALERNLPPTNSAASELATAVRYAALNGGKRVRGALVYGVGEALNAPAEALDYSAAAIECLHAYSLVHDDLPCMDDDDLRRGKPTVHVKWDEATAVLVGDALQCHAFEFLALTRATLPADTVVALITDLAHAAGSYGMVGGQALDIRGNEHLERIHAMKTGALIRAACAMGARCGDASAQQLHAISAYGETLGLLFQIIDDILDATQNTQTLGKTSGKDATQDKHTYVRSLGLDGARAFAAQTHAAARNHLDSSGFATPFLTELTEFVYKRVS